MLILFMMTTKQCLCVPLTVVQVVVACAVRVTSVVVVFIVVVSKQCGGIVVVFPLLVTIVVGGGSDAKAVLEPTVVLRVETRAGCCGWYGCCPVRVGHIYLMKRLFRSQFQRASNIKHVGSRADHFVHTS
ncbi:hypothetical protein BC828DRAFT_54630 [Blastocladiella britannica]|nr:hypothetical protein BC828DRAFT_54630 [Blastocladiella britannica]